MNDAEHYRRIVALRGQLEDAAKIISWALGELGVLQDKLEKESQDSD